jgi:hypothetical protein
LSHVVIFLCSVVVLIPNGQFLGVPLPHSLSDMFYFNIFN